MKDNYNLSIEQGISHDIIYDVVNWLYQYFSNHIGYREFALIVLSNTNWEISATLTDDYGDLYGVYLLGDAQVPIDKLCLNKYANLKGVEGIALAIDPNIRGLGYGNLLKDYPKSLEIDYVWGQQLKSLNNLDMWLKRRKLVGITDYTYITLEEYDRSATI